MRIYLDEKCRECEGTGYIHENPSEALCPYCSGVGLEPREFSIIGAIDHDTDDFLDYRKHPDWAELQNDELVYRIEEVKP